jgi:hypothetical protein
MLTKEREFQKFKDKLCDDLEHFTLSTGIQLKIHETDKIKPGNKYGIINHYYCNTQHNFYYLHSIAFQLYLN